MLKIYDFGCVKFLERNESSQTNSAESSNPLQCQIPNCLKTFITKSGLKSHIDRQHEGKRFKCKHCRKCLASQFSLERHIDSAHSKDESGEDEQEIETEIVYGKVVEIVLKDQEDTIIQQQSKKIEELEEIEKSKREEIKILREQVKSMRSNDV